MYPDAQRLPALCHVWGCGIFSESLSTPDAEGRSVKEISLRPRTHKRRRPLAAAQGPWRHTAHSDPRPSLRQAPGCARLLTHTLSVSPSPQATVKLKTPKLWGNGLVAQTKSQTPRGNRPVYNSDILIYRV